MHIDWFLMLSGLATIGIPTALVLYSVKRMRDLAGPHLELEPQHIVSIVLTFPTTEASLQSLESLVHRADFRSPETRRDELRRLKSWLAEQDLSEGAGGSVVLRQSRTNPGLAGPGAERLAEAQVKRLETPRPTAGAPSPPPHLEQTSWCIPALVAALAASVAENFPEGNGLSVACQSHDALKTAAENATAMNAFYLFYSPAPRERLTQEEAGHLTADLQAIVSNMS